MKENLHRLSIKISRSAGSTWAFILAMIGVLVWAVTGPAFHYSNTWLLAISTITDVVIFLMVFSIQYTQSRDSKAIQLKLNELIVANKQARDTFVGLESLTDDELNDIDSEFKHLLEKFEPSHAIHKLHKKIAEEKKHRFNLPDQAEHLVDTLLSPFSDDDAAKK